VILIAVAGFGLLAHCGVLRFLFPAVWHDLSALVRRLLPARMMPWRAPTGAPPLSAPR
jgi:hypothetical protein